MLYCFLFRFLLCGVCEMLQENVHMLGLTDYAIYIVIYFDYWLGPVFDYTIQRWMLLHLFIALGATAAAAIMSSTREYIRSLVLTKNNFKTHSSTMFIDWYSYFSKMDCSLRCFRDLHQFRKCEIQQLEHPWGAF